MPEPRKASPYLKDLTARGEVSEGEELILVVRKQRKGREATPWLEPYRQRMARLATKCSEHFKGTDLQGPEKVRAMNRWLSEQLKKREGSRN